MSEDRSPRRPFPPLPPEYVLDALTRYIYRHFSRLLTDEELAAERVFHVRAKELMARDPEDRKPQQFSGLSEVKSKYPALMRQLSERGPASVMREATDRVLRDNPEMKILHKCAKCGELCLTPKARFCMACGFSWHSPAGE